MQETDPAIEHGGEQNIAQPNEITSKCTQICFVKVYPAGRPDHAKTLYAIHNEQSNRSLARLEFLKMFDDHGPSSPLSLRTCAGLKDQHSWRSFFKTVTSNSLPPLKEEEERWYLPLFGDYHPRKPKQIRVVFDGSARYNGVSLNDILLKGPDLNNSLLGVLMRFRKEMVAFTADIEQMFYSFYVDEEDRNFLRFLWFKNNDLFNDIVDYRMKVHVFGNSPSPAVAIYSLHQSIQCNDAGCDPDVKQFVTRDFYIDDCL